MASPCPVCLYHGTDMKVLQMSQEERQHLKRLCLAVADWMYAILSDLGLAHVSASNPANSEYMKKIGADWNWYCNFGLIPYQGMLRGNALFRYDSLYVTNSRKRASDYAKRSFIFGELGSIAFTLYTIAARVADIRSALSEVQNLQLDSFLQLTTKERQPVILVFKDVPQNELLLENGNPCWSGLFGFLRSEPTSIEMSFMLSHSDSVSFWEAELERLY